MSALNKIALYIGARIISEKLAELGELPGNPVEPSPAELPTSNKQIKSRSAKILSPRVITAR